MTTRDLLSTIRLRRSAGVLAVLLCSQAPARALAGPSPPPPPAPERPVAAPATVRESAPPPGMHGQSSLRTGLLVGAIASQAIAVSLDVVAARAVADGCRRPGDPAEGSERCGAVGGENLGLGLGALASYVTSFGMTAGFGYVQGGLRSQVRPAVAPRRLRAVAWVGGLLVTAGILGTAWSGLATQDACDEAGCDPRRSLSASLLRGASTLAASAGVGLLTWREGLRRVHTGLALGPDRVGITVRLRF